MGRKRRHSDTKSSAPGVVIRDWGNGHTTLRIDFRYRGVRCRETLTLKATASNIKYAARLRGEIINAIERGTFNYPEYFPESKRAKLFGYACSNITVGQLLEDYLKQIEKPLELSTTQGYRKICDSHLIPTFGKVPIRELNSIMIRNWIRTLNLKSKTVSNILTPLRSVIEQALMDEIINKNPLTKIKLSKLLDKNTSRSEDKIDPFNLKEIQAILNAAEGQARNLFQFAFYSGLRTSELIGLEWDDIDWVNGLVHVCRAVVCKQPKKTKTYAGDRKLLLLPPALSALKAQKQYTFLAGRRVFHNPLTDKPWETDKQIRETAWRKILRKAGVRYRYPYQTRHTYASMMLSNGENMMWVSQQMGHVNVEMVMKNYGRWIPDSSVTAGYRPVNNWDEHDAFGNAASSEFQK